MYLVGKRSSEGPLPEADEFPGGKCQPGESAAAAARRECLEETGMEVRSIDLLMRRAFPYPHGNVELEFWLCRPVNPDAVNAAGAGGFRWIPAEELSRLSFPEANKPLIQFLVDHAGKSLPSNHQ
jgi:mutator protein MutT